MKEPEKKSIDKNTLKIEPGTLILIVVALLLIPLLVTGFISH